MGLSETILAAMIGAIATVSAALFQLVMAWRSRSKVDTRANKKGTTARSLLSILALMSRPLRAASSTRNSSSSVTPKTRAPCAMS